MKLKSALFIAAALSLAAPVVAMANDNVPSPGEQYGAGKSGVPSTSGPQAEEGRSVSPAQRYSNDPAAVSPPAAPSEGALHEDYRR